MYTLIDFCSCFTWFSSPTYAGPAHSTVHWSGIQRGLPGIPQSQWNQPRGPEPERVQRHHQHTGDVQ